MARTNTTKTKNQKPSVLSQANVFKPREKSTPTREADSQYHVLGPGVVCDTEPRGYATPQGRSPLEIVVDASEGFIPLWARNTILRWRFQERSINNLENPTAAKKEIRKLFGEALLAWGNAAPIKFTEDTDVWDFEFVMRSADQCNDGGCVLASAFFPDAGRHELVLYPKMFTQDRKEQVDTLIHEIGHIFGLRHFFAKISETEWPTEVFGTHSKFSIMNYGSLSELTEDDKYDLKQLYKLARSGALSHINGTPIRLVHPYSSLAFAPNGVMANSPVPALLQPQSRATYNGGM